MLDNFVVNGDGNLTADVKKYSDGSSTPIYTGVIIQCVTRDGVYVKMVDPENAYYMVDCFLYTPRGEWNYLYGCKNLNYNPENRMPSPILCSGQISKDAITQTINTITEWE